VNQQTENDIVTRPELDAKLEAIESRMDARVARIEAKFDAYLTVAEARDRRIEERFQRIQRDMVDIKNTLANTKWWAIGTGIAVLAIFIGALYSVAGMQASWLQHSLSGIEGSFSRVEQRIERLEQPAPPTE
jgi:hypothetical protein